MCLAIIAFNCLSDWPLIVIANRDELHSRPTLPAEPWSDASHILGGRDLQAGGTWLGMTTSGKLALLTNYREPGGHDPLAPSRGLLTDQYLRGESLAKGFSQEVQDQCHRYNGFNLLLGDGSDLWYCTNRSDEPIQRVKSGIMGLSNASLNTPWPKLTRTRNAVSALLSQHMSSVPPDPASFFDIMQDTHSASLSELPQTGVGPEREKLLGSPFIKNERYGTRCITLIMQRADGLVRFQEKRFDARAHVSGESFWTIDTKKNLISPGSLDRFNF
jgi:uncharacterized protein with NRDE domain